jgi:hypothetical protein
MKYMVIDVEGLNIILDCGDYSLSFPAVVGNASYDEFLVTAELTDVKVQALKLNVWYEL